MKTRQRALWLAAAWLGGASILASAAIEAPSASTSTSSLDGWGPYKFGMTPQQVVKAGPLAWRLMSLPALLQTPGFKFFMGARDIDQFGLHHITAIANFDSAGSLSGVNLSYTRGGLMPDACKIQFEALLTQLEANYGAFEPGDDGGVGRNAALTKSDVVRTVPGGQSQYRDSVQAVPPGPNTNPDETVLNATARRNYDERSITVTMAIVENPKLPDALKIPQTVLAIAPNLANPRCSLRLNFRAGSTVFPGALAAAPVALPNPAPTPNRASPSNIVRSALAVIDDLKKAQPPIAPVLDAYMRARALEDDEDAQIALDKMNPSQKAEAAYIRHDYPLALQLWTPLARKGDADAAASIGSLYEYGLNGVTQDYAKAATWRKLAASEGDGDSQAALGDAYAAGNGVPKDATRAYMWLSLSLEKESDGPRKSWFPAQITKKRDALAAQMSPAELQQAKTMIARCRASQYKKCD